MTTWPLGILLLVAGSAVAESSQNVAFNQRPRAGAPFDQPFQTEDGTPVTLRDVTQGRPMVLGY